MTHITPILGDTEVPLSLTFSENGVGGTTGLAIQVTLFRPSDGFFYDFDDNTFKIKASVVTLTQALTEADATDLKGVYFFNWNSSTGVTTLDKIIAYYEVTSAGKEAVEPDIIEFQADLEADISGLNDLSSVQVSIEVSQALSAINLDHLFRVPITSAEVIDNSFAAQLVSKSVIADFDDFNNTTDSLEAIRDKQTNIESDIAGLNDISPAEVNAECDTAIADAALAKASNLATVDTVVDAIKAVTDLLPDGGALTALLADLALARKMLTNRKALTNGKIGNLITFDDDDSPLLTQDASDVNGNDISLPSGVPARTTKGV